MESLMNINAAASLALALLAAAAVISPRVRDGVVVKLGLILLALGAAGLGIALATGGPMDVALRALGLQTAGLFVIVIGVLLRVWRPGPRRRRASDWVALDTYPEEG